FAPFLLHPLCSSLAAFSPYDAQRIDAVFLKVLETFLTHTGVDELRTSCTEQLCTPSLDDIADITEFQLFYIIIDQSLETLIYTIYFIYFKYTFSHYRSYGGVHSRRISTICQFCNFLHK